MSLKESLEIYNTDKIEDSGLLEVIFRNVSNNYCVDAKNSYKINKIIAAFNNDFNNIVWKFENANEDIICDFKKYIMGCILDEQKVKEIEMRMMEWALFFQGGGIEPSLKECLISRYRKEYVDYFNKQEKKKQKQKQLAYLEYLYFVKILCDSTQIEQIQILQELKEKDKKMSDLFTDYLFQPAYGNEISKDKTIVINKRYTEKLNEEGHLLKTIEDVYNGIFKNQRYDNYFNDLKKIYLIQESIECWIDIIKLNNLITDDNLDLLKGANLIYEINEENNHAIKLTEIAFSLVSGHIIDSWTSEDYFFENENIILISYNDNPLRLCRYLFSKNYELKERDFLFVFEKNNTI